MQWSTALTFAQLYSCRSTETLNRSLLNNYQFAYRGKTSQQIAAYFVHALQAFMFGPSLIHSDYRTRLMSCKLCLPGPFGDRNRLSILYRVVLNCFYSFITLEIIDIRVFCDVCLLALFKPNLQYEIRCKSSSCGELLSIEKTSVHNFHFTTSNIHIHLSLYAQQRTLLEVAMENKENFQPSSEKS